MRHVKRYRLVAVAVGCACALAGCGSTGGDVAGEDIAERSDVLAQEFVVVDTHIDVPYRLRAKYEDVSARTETGDFDHPRARAGGLDVAFMSIYVPASYQETGGAKDVADELIDLVEEMVTSAPDKFAIVRSPAEVRASLDRDLVLLPMGMENGAPIEDDLANVAHFHRRGIRYITLAHSKWNQICDSSYDEDQHWGGLSPFGREVVREMNRAGVMVDVSHISDDAFYQVTEVTEAPVIASHSCCRRFTPGWERNMDDDMIRRLAEGRGVIQINFGSMFLLGAAQKQSSGAWEAYRTFVARNGVEEGGKEAREFMKEYWAKNERIFATMSDVVAQIDHVVQLVGVDHVGLGSDFDGVGDSLPEGLKDVSGYPNLIRALLDAGYSEDDVRKICGENLLRVWSEVEEVARRMQESL